MRWMRVIVLGALVGCGTDVVVPGPGAGGAGGSVAAATGGGAGSVGTSGGGAGAGGSGAMGGVGGVEPGCPADAPTAGDSCDEEGKVCSYPGFCMSFTCLSGMWMPPPC